MDDNRLSDSDNPEWTAADFARARLASEMFPPEVLQLLVRADTAAYARAAIEGQSILARGWRLAA